jgi:hypothetical protein
VLVASAGVAVALGIASLTQTASGQGGDDTSTTVTATTKTSTTSTTSTTTTPKAKPKATKKTISCKAKQYATRVPVESSLEFATLKCGSPLGNGLQQNTASVTRNAQSTEGTFKGPIKLFFATGSLRGTYDADFTVSGTTVTYDGTIKITSGTGEFHGVKGTGTIKGTSADGLRSSLTEKLTLTFPPA